jgi:hypothetical protein
MTDRDEALRDDFHLESTYDYGEEDEWDDDEANWNAEEEEETGETAESKDESTAYLNFLNEEAQKFSRAIDDVEEDDLGEDSVLLESPLDKIEPYQLFRNTLMKMQAEQPQFYGSLAGHLTADDQNVIQNVMVKADEIAAQQAQQAQQAQLLAQQQAAAMAASLGAQNGGAS